jgi:hypothetical protein
MDRKLDWKMARKLDWEMYWEMKNLAVYHVGAMAVHDKPH